MEQSPVASIEELLSQATCAVLIDGQVRGTAWLYSHEGHLLTAGHVLGTQSPLDRVEVCFAEDVPRVAHKVQYTYAYESGIDFAILKLESPPTGRQSLPMNLQARTFEGKFKLRGCGKSLVDFSTGVGTFVGDLIPQGSSANRLLKLQSAQLGEPGYSGGAVFSEQLHAVVAIQIEATTARTGAERDTVLAMPLYRIDKIWPLVQPERPPSLPPSAPNPIPKPTPARRPRYAIIGLFVGAAVDLLINLIASAVQQRAFADQFTTPAIYWLLGLSAVGLLLGHWLGTDVTLPIPAAAPPQAAHNSHSVTITRLQALLSTTKLRGKGIALGNIQMLGSRLDIQTDVDSED